MAKASGLGATFLVDGVNLSGDVGAVKKISAPTDTLDVTGLDKSAYERINGLYDGAIEFNSFFNDASGAALATLKAKGSGSDRVVTYYNAGTAGGMSAHLVAKQLNYDGSREADGMLSFDAACEGNGFGLEYGSLLTAGLRTDTGATNGTGVDGGAASSLGLAATLQVTAFTGTSVTVAIQESSDNGGGDAYAAVSGGAFAAASAVGAQRIVTSLTLAVERYLRVVTTGTFNPATFAVTVTRTPYAS